MKELTTCNRAAGYLNRISGLLNLSLSCFSSFCIAQLGLFPVTCSAGAMIHGAIGIEIISEGGGISANNQIVQGNTEYL